MGDYMYTKVEEAIHFMVKANKGQKRRNENIDKVFEAILSLETVDECYRFFEDICTIKEIYITLNHSLSAALRHTHIDFHCTFVAKDNFSHNIIWSEEFVINDIIHSEG